MFIIAALATGAAWAQQDGRDPQASSLQRMALQQPDELEGMTISLRQDGEEEQEVGSISQLLLSRDTAELYVVFSSDEFLSLGGQDLVVALSDLQLRDDHLYLSSQDAVEIYISDNFLTVEED